MRATSSTTLDASRDHVWSVLADHAGMSDWGPGLTVTVTKPGSPDPNGLGAQRRIKAPGPAPAIVEEVVAFEPGRLLGYRALSGVPLKNYGGEVVLTVVAGGGTRVDYTISADQRVPLVEQLVVKAIATTLLTAFVRRAKATA